MQIKDKKGVKDIDKNMKKSAELWEAVMSIPTVGRLPIDW